MINEPWFQEAIAEEPTFFLLVGHMSVRKEPDSEWTSIVKAIRKVHPLTPIAVFGGHHHIRDCVQEDTFSMSLAAGRYMETVGFMSITGVDERDPAKMGRLHFQRRYLDQNRNTVSTIGSSSIVVIDTTAPIQYAYHAGADFDTTLGQAITTNLTRTAKEFNLTHQYGVAPQCERRADVKPLSELTWLCSAAYYLYRYAHTSHRSIL